MIGAVQHAAARRCRAGAGIGIDLDSEKPAESKRWTPAEAARFITCVADDPLGLAYRIMILSGCRRAELCGLRWAGADLDRGVLTVARTIVQLGGKIHEEATAKSKAGDRLIFLDAETAGLVREHRKAQLAARLRAGEAWQDDDLIFCQPDGRPWMPDHVSKKFRRLAARAGVPVIKLHEGRHTANSLMRDAGVDQELRMRAVGHAAKEINDRYTHTLTEAHQAAAEQTAALVRQVMTSDYARELGEHLDRLAELIPAKGPGSQRLARMTPEDRQYVAGKARAAKHALARLELPDARGTHAGMGREPVMITRTGVPRFFPAAPPAGPVL